MILGTEPRLRPCVELLEPRELPEREIFLTPHPSPDAELDTWQPSVEDELPEALEA
jgi:hypothetical protein